MAAYCKFVYESSCKHLVYSKFFSIIIIIILYFHYVTIFVLVLSLPHVILITNFTVNN